jgi:glycosyltransferase involved in cell wall biosynthesis
MKVLTICIPTYNRSRNVINQLEFLKNEMPNFQEFIDIKVSDNFSEEAHRNAVAQYHLENPFFEFSVNSENLGLVGNIYHLIDLVKTPYIWIVGDDDVLLEGIISNLIDILMSSPHKLFVFFNSSCFQTDPRDAVSSINLMSYFNNINCGKKCIMDLFIMNGSINMFITSCVFSNQTIKEFLKIKRTKLIIDPLLFSFYAASVDNMYVENKIYVLDRLSGISWSNERRAVSYWLIPFGIIELKEFNYTSDERNKLLYGYFNKYKLFYLRMLILAPNKFRKEIIISLGLGQISLFFPSLFSNVNRIIIKIKDKIKIK